MKFLIISHVKHKESNNRYYGYGPYVQEMNLWLKYVDEVEVVAPLVNEAPSAIDLNYEHSHLKFNSIPSIEFTSISKALVSIIKLPLIFWRIFMACKRTDHIHLRCPGNIGLIGCFVQICFPKKTKTAKYAGNWDPMSKQPFSYRLQKKILSSTFLTRHMNVLVYGDYKNQPQNIKPFFTASFYKTEITPLLKRDYNRTLKFLFVGSIVEGKRPLLSLQIIESLIQKGVKATIDFYGEGALLPSLKTYTKERGLDHVVTYKGNQPKDSIKEALHEAHFLLLPSKSEGWPKVVAEAMFFGVIPIATAISCVPYMLNDGQRGILINPNIEEAVSKIQNNLKPKHLNNMQEHAVGWSQNYTLDAFEEAIKKLLKP